MRIKIILLCLVASLALTMAAQPTQQKPEWEWYLAEVVDETFVGRNYFEYYYTPSAADMAQQRERGEVTYFLNRSSATRKTGSASVSSARPWTTAPTM